MGSPGRPADDAAQVHQAGGRREQRRRFVSRALAGEDLVRGGCRCTTAEGRLVSRGRSAVG